ncbi:hypothetical protein AcV5_010449 [Taiwanofungus camphoratus]|nr:hypothetical protein AcV5_010449 [Antrodia cinnamomea]
MLVGGVHFPDILRDALSHTLSRLSPRYRSPALSMLPWVRSLDTEPFPFPITWVRLLYSLLSLYEADIPAGCCPECLHVVMFIDISWSTYFVFSVSAFVWCLFAHCSLISAVTHVARVGLSRSWTIRKVAAAADWTPHIDVILPFLKFIPFYHSGHGVVRSRTSLPFQTPSTTARAAY